jgi:hypothetical protein
LDTFFPVDSSTGEINPFSFNPTFSCQSKEEENPLCTASLDSGKSCLSVYENAEFRPVEKDLSALEEELGKVDNGSNILEEFYPVNRDLNELKAELDSIKEGECAILFS